MTYKEDNQLNTWGKLLSSPFPSLQIPPLPWMSPQVTLHPVGEAAVVQEPGVGAWRFVSAAPFSFLLLPREPLHQPRFPQGCPCPGVGTATGCSALRGLPALVQRAFFEKRISSHIPNSVPFPVPPPMSFSTLSHASSCASRCNFCHRQLLPFFLKLEQKHCVLL